MLERKLHEDKLQDKMRIGTVPCWGEGGAPFFCLVITMFVATSISLPSSFDPEVR